MAEPEVHNIEYLIRFRFRFCYSMQTESCNELNVLGMHRHVA